MKAFAPSHVIVSQPIMGNPSQRNKLRFSKVHATHEDKHGHMLTHAGWHVRRMRSDQTEIREVAHIQAEAFHAPMAILDNMFFEFFKAEVLSGLLYKLRNSSSDRYACLVAEPESGELFSAVKPLVGVVDVTALRDRDILRHLPGVDEFLYVSGIAVAKEFRRKKVGSALLKACDVLSDTWGHEYVVLRVYENDVAARKLYSNAGYRMVAVDPVWMSLLLRRRRVLMIKGRCSSQTSVFG